MSYHANVDYLLMLCIINVLCNIQNSSMVLVADII